MYDTLTLNDLYALHTKLHDEGMAIHERMMALPSTISDEWMVLQSKHGEISETMRAVYAEIDRRKDAVDA